MADADVHLVWCKVKDARVLQTHDGAYLFWPCSYTERWRWSRRDWPDDGLGLQAHGATNTLPEAIEAAETHRRKVGELTEGGI